jgi:hypothetical protein
MAEENIVSAETLYCGRFQGTSFEMQAGQGFGEYTTVYQPVKQ